MTQVAIGRLGSVLHLCGKARLDPDAAVGNPLGERLGLAHQFVQPLLQILDGSRLETLLDLARIEQLAALVSANIDAIEAIRLSKRSCSNRQNHTVSSSRAEQWVAAFEPSGERVLKGLVPIGRVSYR